MKWSTMTSQILSSIFYAGIEEDDILFCFFSEIWNL